MKAGQLYITPMPARVYPWAGVEAWIKYVPRPIKLNVGTVLLFLASGPEPSWGIFLYGDQVVIARYLELEELI